jgi:hypothetical protein
MIGVDPHQATDTVAVLDEHGELLERAEFRTGIAEACRRWSAGRSVFPDERRWAIEGANALGRLLARRLVSAAKRKRLWCAGQALGACRGALRLSAMGVRTMSWAPPLRRSPPGATAQPGPGSSGPGESEVLKLLSERGEDLVSERTRVLNRPHTGSLARSHPRWPPGYALRQQGRPPIARRPVSHRHRRSAADSVRHRTASELVCATQAPSIARSLASVRRSSGRRSSAARYDSQRDLRRWGPILLAAKIIGLSANA